MKLRTFAVFSALQLATAYGADHHVRRNDHLNRRQDTGSSSSSQAITTSSSPPPPPAPTTSTTVASPPPASPPPVATTTSTTSAAAPPPGTTSPGTPGATVAPPAGTGFIPVTTVQTTTSLATGTAIPPLESISSAMATRPALLPTNNYPAGATPPVSGAPPLPTSFVFTLGEWPAQDTVPPTDSAEVQEWLKELDGHDIPDLEPTIDGTCGSNPDFAADAANRGWWTCGGHIRATDIVACPDKNTWGVSFDDGPSPFTQYLLNYLDEKDILATFFVVGSRVIERPTVLVEEYMKGHEISVHTWSHRALTKLTTAEVVAELGWTRKAIKRVLGVTPTTMRPPFGDIDDRVRAIALAMGMVPIMWSRLPGGGVTFDTNDWRVAGGLVSGPQSFGTFQEILTNSSQLDTGFIVLQHDLYESTVDLAVGYTLPYALDFNPKLTLKPIGECANKPTSDLYLESNTNTSFPLKGAEGVDTDGDGTVDVKSGDSGSTSGSSSGNGAVSSGASLVGAALAVVGAGFAGLV